MDNIPDILDVDDESLIYWSEVSNSSGPIDDELLNIASDDSSQSLSVVSDEGSQPPIPLPIDQQEGAARDVAAPGEGQHDDPDPPEEEVEDEEYDLDYSSEEMDHEEEDEDEDEELPQGLMDLGNAIQPSSDDEEDDEGEQGMPVQDNVPALRAFHLFAPLVQRPCLDDEGRELPNDVYEHMLATWYFLCGSAYQGPRHGETYRESIATEKLLSQETDIMKCIYCSRSQCARTRHYLMNVFLCNMREDQDAATNNSIPDAKGLDEVAGTYVHSAKECP